MIDQYKPDWEEDHSGNSDNTWERKVIEDLAFAAIAEQRKARRWGIFFKSLLFLYLFGLAAMAFSPISGQSGAATEKHTAVVEVTGVIMDGAKANAASVIEGLRAAVSDERTQGVIVKVNSPGGSPVQADYIFNEIRRIKIEHPEMPIHAVITDMCVSGGYYIASAADQIFVNPSSIVGSIGVVMNGFGFVSSMEKLGVERRLLIAGQHKAIMDPFSPVSQSEQVHVQGLLNQIHGQFIEAVKEGRGDRLSDDPNLFSGLVWTGAKSIELGLVDGEGDVRSVARDLIGAETIVDFTPQKKLFERLAHQFGTAIGQVFTRFAAPGLGL